MNVKCPGHSGPSVTSYIRAIYVYLYTQIFLSLILIAAEENSCKEDSQQWAGEEEENQKYLGIISLVFSLYK